MSGFTISIVAGKDKASSSVRVDGSVEHLITDEEKSTFGLSESTLKEAIAKYHNLEGAGVFPDDAYLHDPTPPHGELYKRFGWSEAQTQTVLVASSAEILDVASKQNIIQQYTVKNAGTGRSSGVTNQHEVKNTVTSTWNNVNALSVPEQNLQYNIISLGSWGKDEGEPIFSYSGSWGESGMQTKSVASGELRVELPHNKDVNVTYFNTQTMMKVRICYTANLKASSGAVMYYSKVYQGHDVWRIPLQKLMVVSGIPNSIETTQDIDIEHYSCTTVEIKDMKTQEVIATHYFPESVHVD